MKLWPVYVPSKGRPEGPSPAMNVLPLQMVVEPQEADAYRHLPHKLHVLPESNRGIAFVRNWIKNHAEAEGHPWFWMIDDDISKFYEVAGSRCLPLDAKEALLRAQSLAEKYPNVAQVSLEYQQFAWSARNPVRLNSYCDVCVGVNTDYSSFIHYRPEVNLKEDRDFTLQLLASGRDTLRACHVAFSAPKNGSNKGGLASVYAEKGKEAAASQRLVKAWPGVCEMQVKKDGRVDAKIHWELFKPQNRPTEDVSLR